MSEPIESYALIGDTHTAALVGRDGSVDWLPLPRVDGGAVFAALLGDASHGRWRLGPVEEVVRTARAYRDDTLVLETQMETAGGAVRLVDAMPPRADSGGATEVVRSVEGLRGRVAMCMDLVLRFDYGARVPWVRRTARGIEAVAGPDAVRLATSVPLRGEGRRTVAEFEVAAGDRVDFVLTHHPSWEPAPTPSDPVAAIASATSWWRQWSDAGTWEGPWRSAVRSSARVLKALAYAPTGGIVAAPTTSLPEAVGGVRNWDYRYVWLRDATLTLTALLVAGHTREAVAWRDWLLRAAAGAPEQLQVLYGVRGERRLPELELDWLPGWRGSRPVRVGNGAAEQVQLDVHGEVMDMLEEARLAGMDPDPDAWQLQRAMLEHLEGSWRQPDRGIWEVRGDPQQLTHSKVMAWVAFDRMVRTVERGHLEGPVERWRRLRQQVHDEVCERGFDVDLGSFTQTYEGGGLDASLLLLPQVGFLPGDDERVRGTVRRIEERLVTDDIFVTRYETASGVDGLPGGEGAFLLCSFWLADTLAIVGRQAEARERFERLLALRNDVGLLAEEVDPATGQMLGNFPQAFSHVGLINTAANLTDGEGPAHTRGSDRPRRHHAVGRGGPEEE